MPLDVTRVIGAVTREISSREVNGAPARVLVAVRSYDTDMEDLWDAITNPERIPRWFSPVTGDFRLGGRYQIQGNASGEIVRCEPPRRLGLTWEMMDNVSWVNADLTESAGGTELRLEHIAHVPDDWWDQYGAGATGVGWDSALLGLDQYYAAEASVTPEQGMAWLGSEEGGRFVRASSDAWCEVSIAAGDDPDQARARAERTRQAYTGESGAGEDG